MSSPNTGSAPVNRDWVVDAACGDLPPDKMRLFLPDTSDARENYRLTAQAKSYCATCPVVAQCLAYALAQGITVGVWGNTTARARRDMQAGDAETPDAP